MSLGAIIYAFFTIAFALALIAYLKRNDQGDLR